MPTPRPIIVVRLRTKTDIGVIVASTPMMVSETAMTTTPMIRGISAATRAPKASSRMTSVSGNRFSSSRLASSALTVRMSRSSAERPVTVTE